MFDLRDAAGVTDYVVLASGSSAPHLKAMAGEVQHALKNEGVPVYRLAGTPDCGWLVLDYLDAVIHIFERGTRAYYGIDALWEKAPRLG